MRKIFATSAIALLAAFTTARPAAADDPVNPPEVPGNLQVSSEFKAFLIGDAYGTQNYVCLPSATAPAGFAWTLYGPDATLFSSDDQQIVTHFLSPNPAETGTPARAAWQSSRDSSRVWAVMVQSSSDSNYVAPGAIPWFKLEVVGAQYGPNAGNKLVGTKFIQRVNTAGGVAPATGCAASTDVGKKALVPYRADYVFYK